MTASSYSSPQTPHSKRARGQARSGPLLRACVIRFHRCIRSLRVHKLGERQTSVRPRGAKSAQRLRVYESPSRQAGSKARHRAPAEFERRERPNGNEGAYGGEQWSPRAGFTSDFPLFSLASLKLAVQRELISALVSRAQALSDTALRETWLKDGAGSGGTFACPWELC